MEQKYDETSEKQPDDSPSKQGNKQESGEGASEKQSAESRPESESNGEVENSEQNTKTPNKEKRKLDEEEPKYENFSAVSAYEEYPLSPKKRIKCTNRQVVAARRIGPGEKQLKEEESISRTSAASVLMQMSPKHLPKITGTSEADVLRQESPRRLSEIHVSSITPLQHQQLEHFSSSYHSRSQDYPGTPPSGSGVIRNPPIRSTIHSPIHSPIQSPIPSPIPSPNQSPNHSPNHSLMHSPMSTIPETSAGAVMEGSRRYSPPIPGTSVSCDVIQGSQNRPPIKRTCTEHQSYNADLVEKRFKEESGYQSDSALDLRKDFKKQMTSSTQPPELDRQRTSSDKIGEKPPEEKYATQSTFPRDPRSSSSEATPGDGREANVSSTSDESFQTTTGEVTSSAQKHQVQNKADKSKKSPRESRRNFGARPKESKGRSRSEERIRVYYPRDSPAKLHYGGPIITRINPEPEDPSESSGFRVPLPPEDTPPAPEKPIENMLDMFNYIIERVFENVTEREIKEQQMKEEWIKAKKAKENFENYAKNWLLAKETTQKLQERGQLKGGEKSTIVKDDAVAGPSTSGTGTPVLGDAMAGPATSRGGTTERSSEENVEVAASVEKYTSPKGKSTGKYKSKKSIPVRENLPLADQGICDENANITGEPPRSACEDDNANKSEACTVPTNREGAKDNEEQSSSDVAAQTPRNQGNLSLRHLLPHMDEISLNDSLENIVIPDSDKEDDNVDLQKYS